MQDLAAPSRATIPCRRCGAPLDLGAKALLLTEPSPTPLALDVACGACGRRALYRVAGPLS